MGRQTYECEQLVVVLLGDLRGGWVQRTYIDDLESFLEKLVGLVGEMILDAILGGLVGLVYVDSLSWAAELGGSIAGIGGGAADGVVEYEDAGCAGAVQGGLV